MKKVLALIVAMSVLFSTSCANMSRSEKLAVGATLAVAAVVTIILLGSKSKDKCHSHKRHKRGCRCNVCYR